MPFSTTIETFIGRLLISQRGRDAKLFTRSVPSLNCLKPTLIVTSPLGESPCTLLAENTPLGSNNFPPLTWKLPDDGSISDNDVRAWLVVVEDADAPLPNIPGARRDLGESDFIPADGGEKGNGKKILEGGFRYGGCCDETNN